MRFNYSPLTWAIISVLSPIAYANQTESTIVPEVKLHTIVVEARKADEVGKTTYGKEDLEKTPNGSKTITEFLKVNPNVQFNSKARSALQQGELNAADISINGGLPYDNKFLINGMSINNNINPASTAGGNTLNEMMGSSQSVTVNTDLLCNLTILDSNVSAEYGEFTGGVVSAETCAPQTEIGKIHGSISYDYTTDDWAKIEFPSEDAEQNFEESASESKQPFFTRQGVSATAYGRLSETLAFNSFGSYRRSDIPLKTSIDVPKEYEQSRDSTNAGLEFFYTPNANTELKVGTQFMESSGDYYLATASNSQSMHSSDSQSFYVNLKNRLKTVDLEQQLNYQTQTANRESAKDNLSWAKSSTKNWKATGNQTEGSFGSTEQQEQKLEYNIKALFAPIVSNRTTHTFKMGAGYGHYNAYWERPETTGIYFNQAKNIANLNCYASNGERYDACDEGNGTDGQYLKSRTTYLASKIDVQQDRWHAFLQDQIQWDKYFIATLGVRTDYDSLTKNNNVAPRSSFTLMPFGNSALSFTTGWNRYYGLNSFYNELQDGKNLFTKSGTRVGVSDLWTEKDMTSIFSYRSQLDTPYTDETMFGIQTEYANTALALKWLNRDNKDQLRRTESVIDPAISATRFSYTYDNEGTSNAEIYTLSLKNIEPLKLNGTHHQLSLNADYTQTERNFESYSSSVYTGTPQIYYDGKIINAEDKPAEAFNTPWTIRLGWDIVFDALPLQINNFFSYQGKVDAMKETSKGYIDENGTEYDKYTPYTTKNSFYWDIRSTYTISHTQHTKTIFGLTINNVTNRNNFTVDSGVVSPQIGRQFIADVTFKF
ncbi:TonB-dependent receptor plug domain-containing protein [Acinetobacter sp. ANC 3813]|uniref:TonB-dependent receptor plug domain-containing protein n=1 Tax=Acinetobacter sp. ANC 3813 TaxID=1977873 RepID=UPI000A330503|nr:TonB-dependent receptor plug domain-containing protein [Acinetobacter sp. ANC 3813]OTG86018.1 hypothetical protein B9T34_18160 [Acinetobacter sp. ANC 3813]